MHTYECLSLEIGLLGAFSICLLSTYVYLEKDFNSTLRIEKNFRSFMSEGKVEVAFLEE